MQIIAHYYFLVLNFANQIYFLIVLVALTEPKKHKNKCNPNYHSVFTEDTVISLDFLDTDKIKTNMCIFCTENIYL